ncbi:hypothetical protein [Burkholderia sp. A1]|uniref:hypothetical protein n=1 Tax=Burkholderia sp. A1 TaxID=148446 RepID=UPI000468BD9B|nr:hypothetical protein [Burkholderia sp. A1]
MNPLRIAVLCLTLAGFAAGMIAAFWWYRASEVGVDPAWSKHEGGFEPVDALQSQAGWLVGLLQAADVSARLNQRAAQWTAVSVLLTGFASLLGLFA